MGHSEKWGDSAGDLIAHGPRAGRLLGMGKGASFFFFKATFITFLEI